MDLSAIMNEGSGPAGASSAGRQSSRPPSQHMQQQPPPPQHPGQHHPPPSTPIQNVPPPSFHHDHPQSVQPSPNYHLAHAAPTNFASSPPYGAPTSYGAPGRPPPPPLQQLTTNNSMRSPSAGPAHVPPSPYARTPVAQPRGDSAAYPFPSPGHPHPHPHPHPHQHQDASPVQQHRYIPPNAYPHRDSYSQPSPGPGPGPSPGAMGHGPPPPGYFSSHQVMGPHTPPVGTPGGAHPYLTQQQHSRSTSVQSQQSYPPQQPPFASPVSATRPPPPSEQQPTRQLSQPPTPQQQQQQGPPLSTASRHSGTFAQPQPPSPYQQRVSSSGAPYPPYPAQASLAPHQQQQQQPQPQSQPPPPQTPYQQPLPPQHQSPHVAPRPHPSIQRAPSGYDGAHDQQQHSTRSPVVDPHHRASLSHSERDRSISVSPKTRVPSLPSSVGRHSQASLSGPSEGGPPGDFDPRDPRHLPPHQAPMKDAPSQKSDSALPTALPRADRASTPAKRKLDDRDIKPEDLDRQEPRPPPFQANGAHRPESSARPTAAPVPATRRKPRHLTAPIWSQPYNKQDLHHPNYHLRKTGTSHPRTNGSAEPTNSRQERAASRHVSPEASRGVTANHAPPRPVNPDVATLLGPWEQTFANKKPIDAMVRAVADFLYFNVVSPPELKDLSAQPGIEFEIEAKLGCLVDRNLRDNTRKEFGISTEAVVRDECPFHSSMTEVQHKRFNDFLNSLVSDTSPQNPKNKNSPEPRVPINYVHIKEIDKFYELPAPFKQSLPPVLQGLLRDRGRPHPTLRVTTDKSGRVVAKIMKIKLSNLHIHFPMDDLDCRISVNIEVGYDGPVEGLEQLRDRPDRHKDRLSYSQGPYRADLTQVTQPEAGQANNKKIHELEIELNARAVVDQGRRAAENAPHNYDFLIQGFVDNIRLLARMTQEMR